MPQTKNPNYISWRNSIPRCILIEDLIVGILPVEESKMSAEEAWDLCYQHMAEFIDVVFSQFEARLRDHRKQVKGDLRHAQEEEAFLAHDRRIFPRSSTDHRGKLVFDLHPAKEILRDDVSQKKHVGLTPFALWKTRDKYQEFDQEIFQRRIYQTIRREKFINYLNQKRKEGKLMRCKPPDASTYV